MKMLTSGNNIRIHAKFRGMKQTGATDKNRLNLQRLFSKIERD